jgi:hypothetical protein
MFHTNNEYNNDDIKNNNTNSDNTENNEAQTWLNQGMQWLKENQPAHITGNIMHSLRWTTANGNGVDVVIPNSRSNQNTQNTFNRRIGIYCIHGTADNEESFRPYALKMCNDLPEVISAFHLLAFTGRWKGNSIAFFAKQLLEKIKANNDTEVILMGHSRGGVICAYFAEYLAKEENIKIINPCFPISSPFKGSPWARWPLTEFSESIEWMQENEESAKALLEKMKVSDQVYDCVIGGKDSLVAIESACPRGQALVFDRHSHLSIMTSEKNARRMLSRIYSNLANLEYLSDNDFAFLKQQLLIVLKKTCLDINIKIDALNTQKENQINASQTNASLIDTSKTDISKADMSKTNINQDHINQAEINQTIMVIYLLKQLRNLLLNTASGDYIDTYPEAKSLDEIIITYLNDPSQNDGRIPPIAIFSKPATTNFFSSLWANKPELQLFIETLIEKCKYTLLPERLVITKRFTKEI